MLFPNTLLAHRYLIAAGGILIAGTLTSCYFVFGAREILKALITTIITAMLFLLTLLTALPYIEVRSIFPLAVLLKTIIQPSDHIITYNQYYQDLPFYLERPVTVLNWHNELSFGMQQQDTSAWMINEKQFWQLWHSDERSFVVMDFKAYQHFLATYPNEQSYLIRSTTNKILMTNHSIHLSLDLLNH